MPLPNDATLTLQGQSRPGDPLHVKPKQAMLFRMSAETFEQLEGSQNPPRLEFEFGNTPGLYINDTFYPVTVNQENGPHELYLRMASAQKPMAPLKLYANVIGKFMVERQLGEKVEGSVRDRTLEAEKLRTERKTVYLDTPPDLGHPTAKGKSKKDAAAARRPAAASGSHSLSSARASRVASPLPGAGSHARGSSSDISMTRARLIHCLALRPRTTEAVIQLCAGKNPAPQLEEDLLSLLPKVAEPKTLAKNNDPHAAQCWQLKLESWLEVRPYEWPNLSAEERTLVSRQARTAYSRLKIPESDPVWEHARYRDAGAGAGASAKPAASASAAAEPKKGMMSKSTAKKGKAAEGTRKKVPDIIVAKDESARPGRDAAGSGKGKARERDADEGSAAGTPTSASRPPVVRRLPGSGYQVKASATPPATEARAHSPFPPLPPPPPKKSGPVDARESKRELPAPSGSAKALPPIAPPTEHKPTPQFQKKSKEARAAEERREERQRERDRQAAAAAADEKPRVKSQGSPIPAASLSFKRKKLAQDGNDSEYSEREVPLSTSASKKRRLDEQQQQQQQRPPPDEKPRVRDPSLPKKPVTTHEPSPRLKVKKEERSPPSLAPSPPPRPASRSPLPPRPSLPDKPHPPPSSSSSSSAKDDAPHRASSSKRRRSPVFTSSEDESDPRRRAGAGEEPPAAKRLKARTPRAPARFRPRATMPADRAGLRSYYKQCFLVYIKLYNQQAQRRDRIERLLQETEGGGGGGEGQQQEASDEEGDVADLDPEVLVAFMAEFRAVVEEMDRIRVAWERTGGRVSESGELVDG